MDPVLNSRSRGGRWLKVLEITRVSSTEISRSRGGPSTKLEVTRGQVAERGDDRDSFARRAHPP
eukprot:2034949-Rhodomonas_salina.1